MTKFVPNNPHEDDRVKAVDDVLAERQRQFTEKGWTLEHDDEHDDGGLAAAAACYALHSAGVGTDYPEGLQNGAALFWPWDKQSWKPKTPREDLVRAAAMLLAEIERHDRAAARGATDAAPLSSDPFRLHAMGDAGHTAVIGPTGKDMSVLSDGKS